MGLISIAATGLTMTAPRVDKNNCQPVQQSEDEYFCYLFNLTNCCVSRGIRFQYRMLLSIQILH